MIFTCHMEPLILYRVPIDISRLSSVTFNTDCCILSKYNLPFQFFFPLKRRFLFLWLLTFWGFIWLVLMHSIRGAKLRFSSSRQISPNNHITDPRSWDIIILLSFYLYIYSSPLLLFCIQFSVCICINISYFSVTHTYHEFSLIPFCLFQLQFHSSGS